MRLGPSSDVYSLGATLYYLLTGRPPFADGDIATVLRHVRRGEFSPPKTVNSNVTRALDSLCLKAMAVRPDDRYDSARRWRRTWSTGWPTSRSRRTASRWCRVWLAGGGGIDHWWWERRCCY